MLETEYDEQKAMELFRLEGWNEGRQVGITEGIIHTISAYRECGLDDNTIISRIMEKYNLSTELAGKYVSSTEQ
ncbi:MAG: hypothetical protein IJJ25_11465 [Lachnospiraceae bacterium]|nr:hypothetical protein [Lachnospiraceae bacterium]